MKIINRIKSLFIRSKLGKHGKNVYVHGSCCGNFKNVYIGNHVTIGRNNDFNCLLAKIYIGNYVMTAPEVMFITGDHEMHTIGKRMAEVCNKEKSSSLDSDIIIDDDVWIGARAIILKGVHIYEGAVVAAGSIVTRDVPAYSVVGGVPACVIKYRFNEKQKEQHIQLLKNKK